MNNERPRTFCDHGSSTHAGKTRIQGNDDLLCGKLAQLLVQPVQRIPRLLNKGMKTELS